MSTGQIGGILQGLQANILAETESHIGFPEHGFTHGSLYVNNDLTVSVGPLITKTEPRSYHNTAQLQFTIHDVDAQIPVPGLQNIPLVNDGRRVGRYIGRVLKQNFSLTWGRKYRLEVTGVNVAYEFSHTYIAKRNP